MKRILTLLLLSICTLGAYSQIDSNTVVMSEERTELYPEGTAVDDISTGTATASFVITGTYELPVYHYESISGNYYYPVHSYSLTRLNSGAVQLVRVVLYAEGKPN